MINCTYCGHQMESSVLKCPICGQLNEAYVKGGRGYEWRSETEILGWPLVHVAFGKDSNGRWRIAKGIIAIGQFGIGLITFAQIGVGVLFGFGQIMFGLTAVAQIAITLLFGVGQLVTGYVAIGQIVLGVYGLAQVGLALHIWTPYLKDEEAVRFFRELWRFIYPR